MNTKLYYQQRALEGHCKVRNGQDVGLRHWTLHLSITFQGQNVLSMTKSHTFREIWQNPIKMTKEILSQSLFHQVKKSCRCQQFSSFQNSEPKKKKKHKNKQTNKKPTKPFHIEGKCQSQNSCLTHFVDSPPWLRGGGYTADEVCTSHSIIPHF